jgi:hypothetical protein
MPRTTALLGTMLMSLAPLACVNTVHPGLVNVANVPATAISPVADASVQDVVPNGSYSCERRFGPGPLRYEVPPCPGVDRPAADPTVANRVPSAKGIVMPWVEHYYSPCASWKNEAGRITLARLASPYVASDFAFSGLTCAWPL